ncbi:hypothetical protein CBER1_10743 [Cercospora berteroae]|uniref:Uncharacterized protein n=1 Tax=Cercospora berteroae TaxID=357750 RepID=A0A2S6BY07_9PEZI|nr:hypothetical protein CBER1_10743 [Cercospora berteroae]
MDKKVAACEKDVRAYDRQVKEAITTHYKELREYAQKQSANLIANEEYPILDTRDCHVPTPPSSDVSDVEFSSVAEITDDTDDESCDSSESSVSSDEEKEVAFVDGPYQFPDGFKVFAGHPTYEQVVEELELVKDGKTPILAIPDNVPLVRMHNPKRASSAYKDSRKAFMTPCQLTGPDDTFMPKLDLAKQARRTWDGANLQLSLNSKALSPSLRLTISCYRNKEDPAATAFVDFYFAEIHRRDPSAVDGKYNNVRGVTDVTYAFSDDGKSCDIAWTSYAGVPTNLPVVSTRNNFQLRPSETKLIDELLGLANPDDSGAVVQLRVPLSDEEQTARNTGAINDFKLGSFFLSLPGARNVGKT